MEFGRSQKSEARCQMSEVLTRTDSRSPNPVVSLCLGGESPIRFLGSLAAVGVAVLLLTGCVGVGRVEPVSAYAQLEPEATVELGSSAAAIGQDGETLLVLENSGTRVVRYSFRDSALGTVPPETMNDERGTLNVGGRALSILDTIPLTDRVTAPAGIATDRFYLYIYDDHTLYRTSKDKLNLQPWLGDVRVAGLASFEPGIMLVSDADRNVIWYKGLFGESRLFLSSAEAARPAAMVALRDGGFAVLRPASRLLLFLNRSGVVMRSVSLPAACDLLAANEQGTLCMGVRGKPQVWVLEAGKMTGYSLPDSVSPLSFAVVGNRLVVLDAGTRLGVYRIAE